ncbi:MAG: class I SAM-dependent methyltransferase [Candidatus Bathyarchaeia archaeon]|jgi:ubiquinone/menaquinone biosynthesis C-methylase UbiE
MKKQLNRWLKARDSEKDFWAQKNVKAIKTSDAWAAFVRENFGLWPNFSSLNVLEVGCGPYGIINFTNSSNSVGIDPLKFDTWTGQNKITSLTPHLLATGESLPFCDNIFDICVCFNVLDHSITPTNVLQEITRVLKPTGELLLWVHAVRNPLRFFAPFFSLVDKSHPHHFTLKEIEGIIAETSLVISFVKTKDMGEGNVMQQFVRFISSSFKLAIASFMMLHIFIRAQPNKKALS